MGLPWRAAQLLLPLLIAVPVLYGIAATGLSLVSEGDPDILFSTTVNSDAEALYLGQATNQDPADGYTGQLYTPLFPALVSLLHHVRLWSGWPVLVNLGAGLALIGLAAALAYRRGTRGAERVLQLVGAVGAGVLAWWLVDALGFSLLYEGRSDHLAWAFALFGLVLLARSAGGTSRAGLAGAVLLLSAAFWTKQTTVTALAVAGAWIVAAGLVGWLSPRRALALCAALLAVNALTYAALNLLTDGWQSYFAFEMGRRHIIFGDFLPSLEDFGQTGGLAVALALVLGAGLAWRTGARPRASRAAARRVLERSADARTVSLLVAFVLLSLPAAVYFRMKIGGDVNAYIGLVWALGLLVAIALRQAQRDRVTTVLAGVCCAGLFVAALRPDHAVWQVNAAPLARTAEFAAISPPLRAYSRSHLVWEQVHSDLNVAPQGSIYPNFYNFADLLAAGRQPLHLVDALLDRRFDAVAPIRFDQPISELFWDIYTSSAGREEANYIWKLNQVMGAGYGPAASVPAGYLQRRPGAHPAPWMRGCFGPFTAAGTSLRIRAGGGFWCREPGDTLVLRRTPAARSELRAEDRATGLGGALAVTLPRVGGSFRLRLADGRRGWSLDGRVAGGALALGLSVDGRRAAGSRVALPRSGRLLLRFTTAGAAGTALTPGSGGAQVALAPVGSGELTFTASRGSDLRLGLGALRLRRADG